jgi:hypothetical protein
VTVDGLTVTDRIPGLTLAVTVAVLALLAIAGVTTAAATARHAPSDTNRHLRRVGVTATSARGGLRVTRTLTTTVAQYHLCYGTAVHVADVPNVGDWSVLELGPVNPRTSLADWPAAAAQLSSVGLVGVPSNAMSHVCVAVERATPNAWPAASQEELSVCWVNWSVPGKPFVPEHEPTGQRNQSGGEEFGSELTSDGTPLAPWTSMWSPA